METMTIRFSDNEVQAIRDKMSNDLAGMSAKQSKAYLDKPFWEAVKQYHLNVVPLHEIADLPNPEDEIDDIRDRLVEKYQFQAMKTRGAEAMRAQA